MNGPAVDEVLNYLSIKFNKIFCDRDFVCCVIQDFQTILSNKNKICVLVFPTLGPTYRKALRYQAKIFDLAVFNITSTSGRFKSVAVCHKDHLKKAVPQPKDDAMSDLSLSKRKRPERQLYVPPAQRTSRLSTKHSDRNTKSKFKENTSDKCASEPEIVPNVLLNLSDVTNLQNFENASCEVHISSSCCHQQYQHNNCAFKKFLDLKNFDSSFVYDHFVKFYDIFYLFVHWKTDGVWCSERNLSGNFAPSPLFDLSINSGESPADKPSAVLLNNDVNVFDDVVAELLECENCAFRVECDKISDDSMVVDLAVYGHFFVVSQEESDYLYECQEQHDAVNCYISTKAKLENSRRQEDKLNVCAIPSEEPLNKESDTSEMNGTTECNKDTVKNQINRKKKITQDKHEQEKEIMRITKEYINRKNRPLMKYVDDSNDLQIGSNDSINNWEDLFDDNGEIQEQLLTEIVDKVGDDITIVKASEDYTAYTTKPPEELEHIVELYNFPSTLETHDLVQAFSDINSDAMYIKWVDDTHALLVLGSLSQAQKAVNMRNPLIKVRPMTAASAMSMDVAIKSDLRPAMKRPPTNLQTARRLITTHLGTKSKLTKEQIAKEKEDLKNAREMKRMLKQNERDAWEGNIRSSVN